MLHGLTPRTPAHRIASRLPSASLPDGVDQAKYGGLALGPLFNKSRSCFAELPISFSSLSEFFNAICRKRPQLRLAFYVRSEDD